MEKKNYTQFGKFSVYVLGPLFILSLILLLIIGFDDLILVATLSLLSFSFLICLMIFYKLTISIDSTYLSFSLGIGLVSKQYLIANIKSCKAVKNDPFYGIGIRLIPQGWLYNVSGLKAIELTFKNRSSKIRIGTDIPDEIADIINKMVEHETSQSLPADSKRSFSYLSLILVFLALLLPAGIVLSGKNETKINLSDNELTIKGMYSLSVRYSDIKLIDTISTMPMIKRRTNGYAFGNTLKGNFTLNDGMKVKLFITEGASPYIYITTDKLSLYINFRDHKKTADLYNTLISRLRQDKSQILYNLRKNFKLN
jgi:hypothetical protein